MKVKLQFFIIFSLIYFPIAVIAEQGSQGKRMINGPVFGGYYENVHIRSNSVGVYASSDTVIVNSIIEAPVCIQSNGKNLTAQGNDLYCELCIEFTERNLINNRLMSNSCAGQGTNRPDVFGW